MKKCPSCDKTFEDSLKFCQVDGTPLVDEVDEGEVIDPYKTMVAKQVDLPIPAKPKEEEPEEPSEEPSKKPVSEPGESFDPYNTIVAGSPTQTGKREAASDSNEDQEDLLKTMVVSSQTSDDIELELPEKDPKDDSKEETPATPPPSPFSSPVESKEEVEETPEPQKTDAPSVPAPEASENDSDDDKPSVPIPSPFDKSMPPGYSRPSTPPFDPSEPVKAEKVVPASTAVEKLEVKSDESEDLSPPPAPIEEWKEKAIEKNIAEETQPSKEQNQTLAIISLASGILSMLCCISIVTGPVAIITGFMARGKIAENPNEFGGGMLALVGMITGAVGTILFIVVMIAWLVIPFINF